MTNALEPANYKGRESFYWLEQLEAHVDEGGQIGERAARDLLNEVKRFRAEKEGYRCFHCKMIFTDEAAARDHFGEWITDTPKCLDAPRTYKFDKTYCSNCGREFGPGDHGHSHCEDHS